MARHGLRPIDRSKSESLRDVRSAQQAGRIGRHEEAIDGKQRRKFETGFKQQIVSEIESGALSVNAASRKYQLSGSVIDRWRRQARQGV